MEVRLENSTGESQEGLVDKLLWLRGSSACDPLGIICDDKLGGALAKDVVDPLQAAVAMLTSYKAFLATSAALVDPSVRIPTGTLDDAIQAIKYAYSAAENMRG